MTRVQQTAQVSKLDVLANLARSVSLDEVVVQVDPSVAWPYALNTHTANVGAHSVGMLHLGEGRHEVFEIMIPYLAKGAIILMEGYALDSPAYNYAMNWAARGYLSSLAEARHWPGVGLATYLGGTR
jgi:hypothetical protein